MCANYCFIAPVLPGGIELMKKWNEENIVNNKEHDTIFKLAGISREQVWIQHLPQQNQDFVVASYETSDPEQSFKVLATSKEPWVERTMGCKISRTFEECAWIRYCSNIYKA